MKLLALILPLVFAFTVTGCNNSSETKTLEAENATDSVSTPTVAQEGQDTTMQPQVELMLRATGDTPDEMAFDQDTLHVEKNALIKLSLVNEGAGMTMIHNFV